MGQKNNYVCRKCGYTEIFDVPWAVPNLHEFADNVPCSQCNSVYPREYIGPTQ
jgi:hypothetical protein